MAFDSSDYGAAVEAILAVHGGGHREMPLANGSAIKAGIDALTGLGTQPLFPNALSPEGALSGLYLYFCGYEESHKISQDLSSPEGSFWHGILHRQEPDAGNSAYWFRRVGDHPVYQALSVRAREAGYSSKENWDPFRFIDYCESARKKPGSKEEQLAMKVQLAEWQLLFNYCARAKR